MLMESANLHLLLNVINNGKHAEELIHSTFFPRSQITLNTKNANDLEIALACEETAFALLVRVDLIALFTTRYNIGLRRLRAQTLRTELEI